MVKKAALIKVFILGGMKLFTPEVSGYLQK